VRSAQSFFELVRRDADRHLSSWRRGYGIGSKARLIFLCPGFQLAFSVRLQGLIGRVPFVGPAVRRVIWYFTTIWFGCDIDPGAQFGPGIYFPHPTGIVIGGEWDIGSNVSILQGVTLGRGSETSSYRSLISDNVQITAGAKVIGAVNIGAGSVVGANAVVLQDVPANAVAVGVPARWKTKAASVRNPQHEYYETLQ
jgi:serine O-acetyltransferase